MIFPTPEARATLRPESYGALSLASRHIDLSYAYLGIGYRGRRWIARTRLAKRHTEKAQKLINRAKRLDERAGDFLGNH